MGRGRSGGRDVRQDVRTCIGDAASGGAQGCGGARPQRARRHVRARQSAAGRAVARPAARPAGVPLSRAPQRRRRADRPHGRAGLRRPHRADRQRPPPHLQGAGRLDQPAGARAGRGLRRQARQPRADPLRQQPGDGGGVAGGDQGRRGGRQHHADAARRRARPRSSTRPRSAWRSATAASPTSWSPAPRTAASSRRSIGFDGTANHDAELDRVALDKPVQVRGGADRARRRGAARLHLGHDRRAQGHHALPPRPADHRRRLRQGGAGRDARRRVRRLAAAGLHLRPRRARDLPAALRRHRDAARERLAGQHDRDHRDLQGDHQLHLAHRLSRHDGGDGRGRRPVLAAHGGVGRRDAAGAGVRGLDEEDRQADPRRHRRHRDAAHLHHQPARRRHGRRHRQAGHRLRGQDRRRRHERGAATAPSATSPCAARPAAAISPTTRQTQLRARRLEPDRRRLSSRTRTASSTSPPAPTT